jgi:hypothetical protein
MINKEFNPKGYDLYEVAHDEWILDNRSDEIFGGSFKDVVRYAVTIGFNVNEIEIAVNEMLAKSHNGAHFGGGRRFIFTFQKDFKHEKAS